MNEIEYIDFERLNELAVLLETKKTLIVNSKEGHPKAVVIDYGQYLNLRLLLHEATTIIRLLKKIREKGGFESL